MTQQEKQNLRRKWKRWFKQICQQISWLEWSNHVYEEIKRTSEWHRLWGGKRIFYHWLTQNYFGTTGIIVRMLVEKKNYKHKKYNTISFRILLEDIFDYYEAIPIANRINKTEIENDIKKIERTSLPISKWVDKRVAHFDFKGSYNSLSVLEPDKFSKNLDDFIKLMEDLFQKYNLLLQAREPCLFPLVPDTWQKPIKRAFSKK
ncbi:MAG: hypothetical protein JW806_10190 [Sedimentisphaerales bacterium]|nr:hypothetical protein [Sedimentisphaerales bacterium]